MNNIRKKDLHLVRPLKSGGMANLTYALTDNDKPVVLRELLPQFSWKPRIRSRFMRGLKMRDLVSPHKNIVKPYKRCIWCPRPYEIIEYVNAANLRDLMMNDHEFAQNRMLEILRNVADAIAHIHSHHLVHLDVKAENILVGNDSGSGRTIVKLTDFDLCRPLGDNARAHLRSGTASYMAPEQLSRGVVSFASDIFAFGVLAYYLVTRRMPFSGETLNEVRMRQISASYAVVEPKKYVPDISLKLNQLIVGCLQKDSAKRVPSMVYLARELQRI